MCRCHSVCLFSRQVSTTPKLRKRGPWNYLTFPPLTALSFATQDSKDNELICISLLRKKREYNEMPISPRFPIFYTCKATTVLLCDLSLTNLLFSVFFFCLFVFFFFCFSSSPTSGCVRLHDHRRRACMIDSLACAWGRHPVSAQTRSPIATAVLSSLAIPASHHLTALHLSAVYHQNIYVSIGSPYLH